MSGIKTSKKIKKYLKVQTKLIDIKTSISTLYVRLRRHKVIDIKI
jgi:hypothetical protein